MSQKIDDQISGGIPASEKLHRENMILIEALEKIAVFAPGNGDVCEIIAKTALMAVSEE